jgi:phosphatidylserine/phosphatidylglycerophosphate/cardiolipin synthase-like enzyme
LPGSGAEGFSGWRDTHARVTGEAVPVLQAVFATMWYNRVGENLFDERYVPEPASRPDSVPIQVVQVLLYQGAYFHAKTICVDTVLCSIGSANMDIRSFSINCETNFVIYDEAATRELEADFAADLRHCEVFSCTSPATPPAISSTSRCASARRCCDRNRGDLLSYETGPGFEASS